MPLIKLGTPSSLELAFGDELGLLQFLKNHQVLNI